MQTDGRVPVKFDRPPVIEVACGVSFAPSKPLKSAHIGKYWSQVASEFPRCEDAPPTITLVETQGQPDSTDITIQIEPTQLPPLRRAWLINAEGTNLLQLQEDRFLFNWKRTADNSYPSYGKVIDGFRRQWAKYEAYLEAEGVGPLNVIQLEMTYFNFSPLGEGILRDHQRSETADRFLEMPEAVSWKATFGMPDSNGRLHMSVASARHSQTLEKGVRLDLTARGLPKGTSTAACYAWFDLAHVCITQGFADLTTPEAHAEWGRTA